MARTSSGLPRRIFLTGATDGLGHALARRLASRGEELYLHGRRPLEQLDPGLFSTDRYCRADLGHPGAARAVERFFDERGLETLDVLVLNAGAGWYGAVGDQTAQGIRSLVDVNLWAPMTLTHALLPRLARARGRIVVISSVVSSVPCPRFAVYAATKAALEGWARSLRIELQGEIDVQVIRPGATRTPLHAKSGVPKNAVDWTRFPAAEDVAGLIERAMDGAAHWVTLGGGNRALRFVSRNLPGVMVKLQARSQA